MSESDAPPSVSEFGPAPGSGEPPAPPSAVSYLPPGGLAATFPADKPAQPRAAGGPAYRRYAVTASHKPGIVALRPLSASDLLDGATTLVRRNAGPVLGLSALVNAAAVLAALVFLRGVLAGGWFSRSAASAVVDADVLAGLLLLGAPLAATAVLAGVLGPLTGEAVLGGRPTLAQAWEAARPTLGSVLGAATVLLAVLVGPWVLALGAVALAASAPVPVLLAVGAVAVLAASATTLVLLPRVALAGPAVALEGLRTRDGLRRAAALARRRYWSILGVGSLAFGLGFVLFLALALATVVAGGLAVDLFDLGSAQPTAGRFVTAASTLAAATLVTPFLAGSVILQYVDARMRTEGLDLVLRTRASRTEGQP